jgi:type IV secretory pathway VirJ component
MFLFYLAFLLFCSQCSHEQGLSKKLLSGTPKIALPVIEFPVPAAHKEWILLLSGDGGMHSFEVSLVKNLTENGFPVVVLDSRKYFWQTKTLSQIELDFISLIEYYDAKWHLQHLHLVGYSYGADVVPFAYNAISDPLLLPQIERVVLIAPAKRCRLEIHVWDWIFEQDIGYEIATEVEKITIPPLLCISDNRPNALHFISFANRTIKFIPGGHHFKGHLPEINAIVNQFLNAGH